MESPRIQDYADLSLQGDRVLLTPLVREDVSDLAHIGLDPRIWEKSPFPMRTEDDIRTYVDTALHEKAEGRSLPFVTRMGDSGVPMGSTRFGSIATEDLRAEIGWTWLTPKHWRTGVNVEAKLLMLTFAFETLGLRRVEFKTDERNARSRAAIEGLGAVFEGILRKHMVTKGLGVRNSAYYSVLDEEWPKIKKRIAAKLER